MVISPDGCSGAIMRQRRALGPARPSAYNRVAGRAGPQEAVMAIETKERIRPVTGTHVVRVQHEGIATADAERSKDFYCKVLGFQVLPRPAFRSAGYWLGTEGIFPQIHIIQSDMVPPGPGAPISPQGRHTCFEVADFNAMKATLEGLGIKYVVNEQPGGRVQMLCNDPDGNTLEFQPATV
jgi:glyoxylase I family protein